MKRGCGLDRGELSNASRVAGIANDGYARSLRRELLEHFKPFAAYAVFERDKSGCVAPRPCHAADETCSDRIDDTCEHDRYAAGDPLEGCYG